MKNIRKKKIEKKSERMAQGKQQPKLKEIPALVWGNCDTDRRKDDRRQTNLHLMSSGDIVKQS